MEYVWKKVGDALNWIISWFGYYIDPWYSDVDCDLDCELECCKLECKTEQNCVCQEPEKVSNFTYTV